MFGTRSLSCLFALALSAATSSATPLRNSQNLVARDNPDQLKCSNAPGIVAGNMVTQADVNLTLTLPESGSTKLFQKYIWCTVNTETYIFLDFGQMDPAPSSYGYINIYEALNQVRAETKVRNATYGDVHVNDEKSGLNNYFSPQATNVNAKVFLHDSVGRLTWGIIYSALTGLMNLVQNYNRGNYPMVFKINDGGWGEVGSGYVGIFPGPEVKTWDTRSCMVSMTPQGGNQTCWDLTEGPIDW